MPKMVISMFVKYIFDDATLLETLALKCRMSQLAVTQRRRHEAEEVRYICERLASDCVLKVGHDSILRVAKCQYLDRSNL